MHVKIFILILLTSFSLERAFANEDVQFDIKSLSWKKINRNFQSKTSIDKTEAFALVRFHEEAPKANPAKRFKLLYSIVTGSYPSEIGTKEINILLKSKPNFATVITRISFWKLYKELESKKLLSREEKLELLEKFPQELDPISISVFNEILKLLRESKDFSQILKKIEALDGEKKAYLYTPRAKLFYGEAIYQKEKNKEEARKIYFQILQYSSDYDSRRKAFDYLTQMYGDNIYKSLNPDELALLFSFYPKAKKKEIWSSSYLGINSDFKDKVSIVKMGNYLALKEPSNLVKFLKRNEKLIEGDVNLYCGLAEHLINSKDFKRGFALIKEFLDSTNHYCKYKSLARIYDKWNDKENFYASVLQYLVLHPYDLTYQDKLIDFLAESKPGKISYAKDKYWEKALKEMPNLPVKGRLVYWYLRFLKHSGNQEKMKSVLETFYSLCSGSYYILVIESEFASEIKDLPSVKDPIANKDSLFRFLSTVKYHEAVESLVGKNLSFAYYKDSYELGQKLNEAREKVRTNSILSLGADYLRIGEMKYGLYLVDYYAKKEKLDEKQKYQLYVGAGDIGNYTYLSLFYTRLLMKLYQIPDDPLLLPTEITSRLYPRPHRSLVKASEKEFGVEEEIIYAIMRQESFFRENARSPANARGLMQVMPATGRFLAGKLKVTDYSLHDPEVSIRFGAKFLADLLKNYDGQITWASIAYNGGPGNLRKWKRNHYRGDFNHFLEDIPAKESRDYCRIIISNYMNYRTLKKMEGLK
jgi:hypothetical protein